MVKRCLFCRLEFPSNSALEHFPTARQVAYDPRRGRLWAICDGCGQWTLAPFESRWEALEELDRMLSAFVVLAKTDNVALLRGRGIRVVRIGEARLREQAWWRYGRRLARRRRHLTTGLKAAGGALVIPTVAALGLAGGPLVVGTVLYAGGMLWHLAPYAVRTARFGRLGWRRPVECLRCGAQRRGITYRHMRQLRVVSGKRAGDLGVRLPCSACQKNGLQFNASEAELLTRRYLAYRHIFGAAESVVSQAASEVEAAGSSAAILSRIARNRALLSEMSRSQLLAFEIAINDDAERALLRLQVAELEARWREAEEVAAIADGELTPVPSRVVSMSHQQHN